jgi:hypothetical protein|tara:strand:+ start:888 stop:2090 length:1203 start_codon:yes stop_codon:yes gene_type:complete
MEFQQFLLDTTKGKVCMHDIFGKCQKECTKIHLKDVKQKNFLKTIMNNVFDSSVIRKLPFYSADERCINCSEEMDKYMKDKNVTDKSDIRYKMCERLKKDMLKIVNEKGKFKESKTKLLVCSKNLFMKYCKNHQQGDFITLDVKCPDNKIRTLDLCYNEWNQDCISICNCNIELTKSKKTERYYIKDIFKFTKKTGNNLSDYMKTGDLQQKQSSYIKEVGKIDVKKKFDFEIESFPTMETKAFKVIKNKEWVQKPPRLPSPVSPLMFERQGPQREISSGSLSEMSSPMKIDFKEFDMLVTQKDIDDIDSSEKLLNLISSFKLEYNKVRDVAIKYYEKYHGTIIAQDNNEITHKGIISDLKKKLEIQYQEQMSCLEVCSDSSNKSDSYHSESSELEDNYYE